MLANFFESGTAVKILFVLAALLIIQFFIIRPRKKEEQKRDHFLDNLKPGTQIVTIGGIHGKVAKINDKTVVMTIDSKGLSLTVNKNGISQEALEKTEKK